MKEKLDKLIADSPLTVIAAVSFALLVIYLSVQDTTAIGPL